MTTKIVIFSANPIDTEQLGLSREFSEIEEAREKSKNEHKFTVLRVVAATVDKIHRKILEEKPKIVHFCGHGLGEKGLVLETKLGQQQPISTQALAGLFKLLAEQVECVILNACYSQAQAEAIQQHINYVIGTRTAIRDDAAIAFSKGFYTALFSGESIERAYELGKNRIQEEIYNPNNQGRKLVPVDTEEGELPEDEVFTFHIKNPLNQIISEETEPSSTGVNNTINTYIGQGNYNENIQGNYFHVEGNLVYHSEPVTIQNKPSNLKKTGAANFVGREEKLEELHQLLQQNEQVTISAIAGMGGIGKTELALQYTKTYQDDYPGSLCWFSVRGQNLATQIIQFAGTYLNLFAPDELKSDVAKVNYCWRNWRTEPSLIVLDDLPDYSQYYQENIAPYLPPATNKIKVLITSRESPGENIPSIDLDVLTEAAALELLAALAGGDRIVCDLQTKKDYPSELCQWLGYLPLGLELVGRYIAIDPSLTLESTLDNLKSQQLKAEELLEPEQKDMTAQLGVAAAFELSWQELKSETQRLGSYLSLFTSESFEWSWVEKAFTEDSEREAATKPSKRDLLWKWVKKAFTGDSEREAVTELSKGDLLKQKRDLLKRNLLQMSPNPESTTEYRYQLHALIAQYLRAKLEEGEGAVELKQKFCQPLIQIARSILQTPTRKQIQAVTIAIPHLSYLATELSEYINDENLTFPYVGLGRFYQGQGIYNQAEQCYEKCLNVCRKRLGEKHLDVATSLNNLAILYKSQGRYIKAKPLYLQALEIFKQLLGEQHPNVATSLNNLAILYKCQGKYAEAEPLYIQSLELRKQLLGEQHPDVATSLNNLAILYKYQGRYAEAEPLYIQALELRKQLLGEQHPDVATSLNNLAGLYHDQGRYTEAEPLYQQALELRKQLLGEQHPDVATSLNNLAILYKYQGRYAEAEPLYIQALELRKQLLGEQHPDVATSLNNLAGLYHDQGRYTEAEPLYQQALELRKQLLGEQHPDVAISLDNLAGLYKYQGRYAEAESLYLQALELLKQLLGEQHPDVVISLANLAGLYQSQDRYAEAEPLYQQALAIAEAVLGENHPNTNKIRENLN